jgi:hypothetical protein
MLNNDNFKNILTFNRETPNKLPDFNKKYFNTFKSVGLCNQLFSIINPILNTNKNFIIIDSFYLGHSTRKCCPITEIIDLEKTSCKMSTILNRRIYLLDRTNIKLEFISVFYGTKNKKIDILDNFKSYFYQKNKLSKNLNINELFNDPVLNEPKNLYITYKLNNYIIQEDIPEINTRLSEELSFDLDIINNKWNKTSRDFGWYNKSNQEKFNMLLNSITFNNKLYDLVNSLKYIDTNTIHLRIEEDSINFWSKQNNISEKMFYKLLIDKYYNLINVNIPKNETLLILSGISKNHEFIKKIDKNHQVLLFNKEQILKDFKYQGNELNAIIDLILGFQTKKNFIGCHNLKENRGSTFTYTILNKINNINKFMIDLDNISY